MPRHIVALTATTEIGDGRSRVLLNEAYAQAITAVGLVSFVVPPTEPRDLPDILAAVDGLVLTGGDDVDPEHYGQRRSDRTEQPHALRDRCELAAVQLARERGLPTLAICRGIQVVNVALGGTLIQDIATECPFAFDHRPSEKRARVHAVTLEPSSALASAIGATEIDVNSSHHQAPGRVGSGLRVTALAPDGIIEGLEWVADDWWMLGVQWHPEDLMADAREWDRALLRAFASRVRGAT